MKIKKRVGHTRNYPNRLGDYRFFTDGKECFETFFFDIRSAQTEILIHFYIVKNDWLGEELLHLLTEKAKQGVQVKLMLDWFGSLFINRSWIKNLKNAGGDVRFSYVPKLPNIFLTLMIRNHQKFAVIDGNHCYIGGLNVGKEYVDEHPKLKPWRDYHVKISGDIGKDFVREFNDVWNGRESQFENNQKLVGDIQLISYDNGSMETHFLSYIGNARNSIFIGTPYFFPTDNILKALIAALKKGIKIEIIIPSKRDHILVKEASIRYLTKLISLGATVYHYKNGFYHAKVFCVDDSLLEVGTFNFNRRSFLLNSELSCKFTNPTVITNIMEIIQKDVLDSEVLPLDQLLHLGLWTKLKCFIASKLENYL